MNNVEILHTENSLYDITEILEKNWNRIYNGNKMSNIYKVVQLWWNSVNDSIKRLPQSKFSNTKNGIVIKAIENLGNIYYRYLTVGNKIVAIEILRFRFILPWGNIGGMSVISPDAVLRETEQIRKRRNKKKPKTMPSNIIPKFQIVSTNGNINKILVQRKGFNFFDKTSGNFIGKRFYDDAKFNGSKMFVQRKKKWYELSSDGKETLSNYNPYIVENKRKVIIITESQLLNLIARNRKIIA